MSITPSPHLRDRAAETGKSFTTNLREQENVNPE
jgi:hypothetical protein